MRHLFSKILAVTLLAGLTVAYSNSGPARSGTSVYVDAVNGSDIAGDGSSSQPWRTITHALARVSAGDAIIVKPGTCTTASGEVFPLSLPSGVRLTGSGRDTTIIAGQSDKTVLYIGSSTTDILSNTLVSDVTLQGGSAGLELYSSQGHSTSPVIASVRATRNTTGIRMSTSNVYENGATIAAVITNTEVISNNQYGLYMRAYGYFSASSIAPLIANSTIQQNGSHGLYVEGSAVSTNGTVAAPHLIRTRVAQNGGHGLYTTGTYQGWANPQIERSWIEDNAGYGFYWEQGINAGNINAAIINTVIARNQGGGVFLNSRNGWSGGSGALRFANNTMVDNVHYGIYWNRSAAEVQLTVVNSIIWNRAAEDLFSTGAPWTTHDLQYSDIQDGDLAGAGGNFSADPLLSDDYHILACSPVMNVGTATGAPVEDIDGDPRPQGSAPDVGADEYEALCYLRAVKQVSADHARLSSTLAYTITLNNTTVITPLSVLMTDTLPSTLKYLPDSLQASQGTALYTSGRITWTDTITPGAVVTINLQTQVVGAGTTIFNSVVADAGSLGIYGSSSARTDIEPALCYLPTVLSKYCTGPIVDNFGNPASGWPIAETSYWSYGYSNSEYRMYAKQAAFGGVTRGERPTTPFIIEIDARQASTTNGSLGLIIGLNDNWSEFYTVEIYPATQEFAMFWYHGTWTLSRYDQSGAIRAGQNSNRLRIVTTSQYGSDYATIYANGTELFNTSVNPLSNQRVGLTATGDAPGFEVLFDNYKLVTDGCPENPQTAAQPDSLTVVFETLRDMTAVARDGQR